MRVALKIAYDGTGFFGQQRQPDVRTVEGECIAALRAAGVFSDPREAFFRSASRTDRGVSAIGNVIAFDSPLRPDGVVGAFNDRAEDVWAWAFAEVADDFHPRHAVERWYRYHLLDATPRERLREAMALFVGEHDFRSFTTDPPRKSFAIDRVDVFYEGGATLIDIRARRFRRGMVRRMVAAGIAYARAEASLVEIQNALGGKKRDFGAVPPEPLFLMDVKYEVPFRPVLKGKALDEWRTLARESDLRLRFSQAVLGLAASQPETPVPRNPL